MRTARKARFAEGTTVPVETTKAEIEKVLDRYGATGFASARDGLRNRIEFVAHGRRVRFDVTLPEIQDKQFVRRGETWGPKEGVRLERWKAECRRMWRALFLAIKAKLEVVESGMVVFETEFMGHIVMPNGRTVSEEVLPAIETAYQTGKMQRLLPETTA